MNEAAGESRWTTLAELPASTTKEEASKLLEAAQKAADNYNDKGCVEHFEEALAKIAQAG